MQWLLWLFLFSHNLYKINSFMSAEEAMVLFPYYCMKLILWLLGPRRIQPLTVELISQIWKNYFQVNFNWLLKIYICFKIAGTHYISTGGQMNHFKSIILFLLFYSSKIDTNIIRLSVTRKGSYPYFFFLSSK